MGSLDGKVALVTGSSSGIGEASAHALAAAGANVVVNSSSSVEAGRAVAAALATAALQPWVPIEFTGRAILLGVLVPLGFLWWYTDWEERTGRRRRRTEQGSQRSDDIGRAAGRLAANAYVAGRRAIKKRSEP